MKLEIVVGKDDKSDTDDDDDVISTEAVATGVLFKNKSLLIQPGSDRGSSCCFIH